jgi:hypothetical protein
MYVTKHNLHVHGITKNVPVRLLGTRFETKNCISEPCPQEPYRDILFEIQVSLYPHNQCWAHLPVNVDVTGATTVNFMRKCVKQHDNN